MVVVPGRIAAWLDRHAGLSRLRIEHRGQDPEVDAVLVALAVASAAWRSRAGIGSDHGTEQAKQPSDQSRSLLTTADAAELLGISDRGVRKAILDGRLPAQRVADVWLVDREDVEHFKARRAA